VPLYFITTLVLFAGLVVLVSSQHRMRLIAGAYQPVDSLVQLASDAPMSFMTWSSDSNRMGFNDVVTELANYEAAHPLISGDALPALDQPDTCMRLIEEGKRIHCYNADIGVCAMLAKQHVLARLWDITGPAQLGGDGHNLLEIFDGRSKTWKAIDPYYHCYFVLSLIDSVATPIDMPTLRLAILEQPSIVRIVRYVHLPDDRPDSNILNELKFLAPCAMLHANNDFRARYAHRYGWLMPMAPVFDKLPLRASRGVRMFMLGSDDLHYIIEDGHSPHYPFLLMKWLFWFLFSLFGIFCVLTSISMVRQSRNNS
jgi:hypothetical protein